MKKAIYRVWQWTWGFPQTLLGFLLFIKFHKNGHYDYHSATVIEWNQRTGVSLGAFIFLPSHELFAVRTKSENETEEPSHRLLVHEYGHTVQSLILGPVYLLVIGIPSVSWMTLGSGYRKRGHIPYTAFYTESWANKLGEWITGEKAV